MKKIIPSLTALVFSFSIITCIAADGVNYQGGDKQSDRKAEMKDKKAQRDAKKAEAEKNKKAAMEKKKAEAEKKKTVRKGAPEKNPEGR